MKNPMNGDRNDVEHLNERLEVIGVELAKTRGDLKEADKQIRNQQRTINTLTLNARSMRLENDYLNHRAGCEECRWQEPPNARICARGEILHRNSISAREDYMAARIQENTDRELTNGSRQSRVGRESQQSKGAMV